MKPWLMLVTVGAAALLAAPALAGPPRTARCVINTNDGRYAGPCRFRAERNGSFAVDRAGERPFFDLMSLVNVTIVRPGHAEVSGLWGSRVSRWGSAIRSSRDRACWIGEDFSVCVY